MTKNCQKIKQTSTLDEMQLGDRSTTKYSYTLHQMIDYQKIVWKVCIFWGCHTARCFVGPLHNCLEALRHCWKCALTARAQ